MNPKGLTTTLLGFRVRVISSSMTSNIRYLNHIPHTLQAYSSLHMSCQTKSTVEIWLTRVELVPLRRRSELIPVGVPSHERPDLINTSSAESTHKPPQRLRASSKSPSFLTPPSLFRKSYLSQQDIFHASRKQQYSRHAGWISTVRFFWAQQGRLWVLAKP